MPQRSAGAGGSVGLIRRGRNRGARTRAGGRDECPDHAPALGRLALREKEAPPVGGFGCPSSRRASIGSLLPEGIRHRAHRVLATERRFRYAYRLQIDSPDVACLSVTWGGRLLEPDSGS